MKSQKSTGPGAFGGGNSQQRNGIGQQNRNGNEIGRNHGAQKAMSQNKYGGQNGNIKNDKSPNRYQYTVMAPRPNSKIQPRGSNNNVTGMNNQQIPMNGGGLSNNLYSQAGIGGQTGHLPTGSSSKMIGKKASDIDFENQINSMSKGGGSKEEVFLLKSEVAKLTDQLKQMKNIIVEKDSKIAQQRADMTSLRKKNFEFRSKIQELQDKVKEGGSEGRQRSGARGNDEHRHAAMAIQMQMAEARQREKEMLMQVMLASVVGPGGAEAEEERLLQRAIEESKAEAQDPNNPDVDSMTYEQILELEESNGKVSKGLSKMQIDSIPSKMWKQLGDTEKEECSICFDEFSKFQRFKRLKTCGHEYHQKCLDQWLTEQKRCPICNGPAI